MSTVKFVHVLKRMEAIDRDIHELSEITEQMQPGRQYTYGMKIAAEREINNLLNERVKLMELQIANPPENLVKEQENFEKQLREGQGEFLVEDYEEEFLQRVMGNSHVETVNRDSRPDIQLADRSSNSGSRSSRRSSSSTRSEERKSRSDDDTEQKSSVTERKSKEVNINSRADLIRDLPPLEY